jgi:hypothetical protein
MHKLILTAVLAICIVGTTQAGMYTFTFDSLANNSNPATVETYMEGIYMGGVSGYNGITLFTDTDSTIISSDSLLGPDPWLQVDTGTTIDQLRITFDDVPIDYVSFEWMTHQNPLYFVASYTDGGSEVFTLDGDEKGGNQDGTFSYDFTGKTVKTLYFHNGGDWIGIDNLSVNSVPLPAGVLLGVLGLGVVGLKLRKHT